MTASLAIVADKVFDGTDMLSDTAVLVANGRIVGLAAAEDDLGGTEVVRLPPGSLLAPGFIDIHVNGGGGVLLNDRPTLEGVKAIAAAHRPFGTTGLLPTLISDSRDAMRRAVDAVAQAMSEGVPGVLGVHLEGPFLNPARKGVHPESHLVAIEDRDLDLLSSLGSRGVTVVTLAPERVPPGTIRELTRRGIRVCAGHTDASAEEVASAIEEGLAGFTHLFNAMSQLGSRAPGAVGAALANDATFAGIIPDGHHVADLCLRIAYKAKGADRLMIVTDAMCPVGTTMASFSLFGREILVGDGRCVTAEGTLAGALIDMAGALRHMVRHAGVPLKDALVMASRTPARFLGLERDLGSIEPGKRADLVALDPELGVIETWIAGRPRR
jgi:N-acetylglucosamine-6-phosphate deacetylase